jgi:nucleotide-binding universal stress UspA family protein
VSVKILLAVDGSEPSDAAVEGLSERLWPVGTMVRVLSVVQTVIPPATTLWYDAGGSVERFQEELAKYAGEITARAARLLEAKGLAAEAVVRHGDPRAVIIDEAEEWDADLIVVGSHGYTGLKRFFLGSVAQSVVSHAPCSVEVIRVKQPRPEEARLHTAASTSEDSAGTPIPIPPA